jgi:hypothetical protein
MFDNKPHVLIPLNEVIIQLIDKIQLDTEFEIVDIDSLLSFLIGTFTNNCDNELTQSDDIAGYVCAEASTYILSQAVVEDNADANKKLNEIYQLIYALTLQIRDLFNSLGIYDFSDFSYGYDRLYLADDIWRRSAENYWLILRKG